MRGALLALAARLRFPWLLAFTALLFVASLAIPDPIPFLDELLLGLLTLVFAAWRKDRTGKGTATTPGEGQRTD